MLGVVTKKTTLRRLERGIFLSQVARYVIVLEFSKWLNENTGKVSPRPGSPKPGSTFQPTKTPASSSDLDDFDLEPTPEVDKNTLIKAGDNFLKELDLKITRMIGKTLNAYKNKGSDAFNRAAITLEKYHEELKNRYSTWMNKLISKVNKAPSPPPMNFNEADQRYSLGAYAQQMYMVAKKIWEDWIHTFLIEKDPALKSAKEWFAINSGYKDIVMKVPQYKKVERLADGSVDGSLDLSQFIKIIVDSPLGKKYKSNARVKEQVDKINDLPLDEYERVLKEALTKFKSISIKLYAKEIKEDELEIKKTRQEIEEINKNRMKTDKKLNVAVAFGSIPAILGIGAVFLSVIGYLAGSQNIPPAAFGLGMVGSVFGGTSVLGGVFGSQQNNYEADKEIEALSSQEDNASQRKDYKEIDIKQKLKKHVAKKFLDQTIDFINEIGEKTANRYMGSVN